MKRALLFVTLLLMYSVSVFAQTTPAPEIISFQGKLATPSGTPVTDGTYSIRFSLWSAVTGGTEKWFQTMNPVLVKNGVFSVFLGNGNPITADIMNGSEIYLEIKVGNDAALSPRQRIASVAYALKANTVPDGAITTNKIADNAVTNAKIGNVDFSKILNLPSSLLTLPFDGSASTALSKGAFSIANTGNGNAIVGNSISSPAVEGNNTGTGQGMQGAGVVGNSMSGFGVAGTHSTSGNYGWLGGPGWGVYGYTSNHTDGAVMGQHSRGDYGWLGGDGTGVYGKSVNGIAGDFAGLVRMDRFRLNTSPRAGDVLTSDANGNGTWQASGVPTGAILMWSGSLASIPSGWALCNGGNGTPDLRDRFVLGASAGENPGATGGSSSHTHSFSASISVGFNSDFIANSSDFYRQWVDNVSRSVSGTTSAASHLPPYYKLAFIMKL